MGEYFLCFLDIIGCINTVSGEETNNEETVTTNTRRIVRQATREVVDEVHKKTNSLTYLK